MSRLAAARALVANEPGPTREVQALDLLRWALTCFQVQPQTTVRRVAKPEHWVRMLLEQRVRLRVVCTFHVLVAQREPTWQSSPERRRPGAACESVLDEKLLAAIGLAAGLALDGMELPTGAPQYPVLLHGKALRLVEPLLVLVTSSAGERPVWQLGRVSGCLRRRCCHRSLRLGLVRLARWS